MRDDQERAEPTPTQEQDQGDRDRTGEYGGDDGAMEHERAEIVPGEDTGLTGTPDTDDRPAAARPV